MGAAEVKAGADEDSREVLGPTTAIAALEAALSAWVDHTNYPDSPVHHVRVLLAIAARGGECYMQDLEKITGRTGSSVSRAIAALGRGHPDKPGKGYLEAFEDPYERRRKIARLTVPGRKVAEAVVRAVMDTANRRTKR